MSSTTPSAPPPLRKPAPGPTTTRPRPRTSKSAFTRFWHDQSARPARDLLLSQLSKPDLLNIRLINWQCARTAAPHAFKSLTVTFKFTTFTKPARLAALARVGQYVRRLTFRMPHGDETFLPPLLEPSTGAEVEYVYTPVCQSQVVRPQVSRPQMAAETGSIANGVVVADGENGPRELADLLVKQYPPLYHAAVNVPSFVRAFTCLVNLKYLTISCPTGSGLQGQLKLPSFPVPAGAKSIVSHALVSLRIAVERAPLGKLEHLTLSPLPANAIQDLSPMLGLGARPNSLRRWRQIKNLTIHMPLVTAPAQLKILHAYIGVFAPGLKSFTFHWLPPPERPAMAAGSKRDVNEGMKTNPYAVPARPISTGTSYFPRILTPQTSNLSQGQGQAQFPPLPSSHRGPNPLTLHMSPFLTANTSTASNPKLPPSKPKQKSSSSSLPSLQSMTSASTLSSVDSRISNREAAEAARVLGGYGCDDGDYEMFDGLPLVSMSTVPFCVPDAVVPVGVGVPVGDGRKVDVQGKAGRPKLRCEPGYRKPVNGSGNGGQVTPPRRTHAVARVGTPRSPRSAGGNSTESFNVSPLSTRSHTSGPSPTSSSSPSSLHNLSPLSHKSISPSKSNSSSSPSFTPSPTSSPSSSLRPLHLPHLTFFALDSIQTSAAEIAGFIRAHGSHLAEFKFEATTLTGSHDGSGGGDWDEALAPLTELAGGDESWKAEARREEEVPICLGFEVEEKVGGMGAGIGRVGVVDMSAGDLHLYDNVGGAVGMDQDVGEQMFGGFLPKPDKPNLTTPPPPTTITTITTLQGRQAMGLSPWIGNGVGSNGKKSSPILEMTTGNAGWMEGRRVGIFGDGGTAGRGSKMAGMGTGQRALEEGVRKLLAQTVFPWF